MPIRKSARLQEKHFVWQLESQEQVHQLLSPMSNTPGKDSISPPLRASPAKLCVGETARGITSSSSSPSRLFLLVQFCPPRHSDCSRPCAILSCRFIPGPDVVGGSETEKDSDHEAAAPSGDEEPILRLPINTRDTRAPGRTSPSLVRQFFRDSLASLFDRKPRTFRPSLADLYGPSSPILRFSPVYEMINNVQVELRIT